MRYKLTESGVFDTEFNSFVPGDVLNRHWQQYLEWRAAGNTPDPQDPPPAEDLARKTRRQELAGFQVLQTLRNMTPQEAAQYVDNNVTDLTSAKQVLRTLAAVVSLLIKEL